MIGKLPVMTVPFNTSLPYQISGVDEVGRGQQPEAGQQPGHTTGTTSFFGRIRRSRGQGRIGILRSRECNPCSKRDDANRCACRSDRRVGTGLVEVPRTQWLRRSER